MRASRLRAGVEDSFLSIPVRSTVSYPSGTLSIPVRNRVYAYGTLSIPVRNTVSYPSGTLSIPVRNRVYAYGTLSIPVRNRVNSVAVWNIWKAKVMLGGVDISDRLTGQIQITRVESAAASAILSWFPSAGLVTPYAWVDKPVTIDLVFVDANGVQRAAHRRFTGVVDETQYEASENVVRFVCSDGLQRTTEAMTTAQIDATIGGYYSATVFGETDDKWRYAQDRLSTQAMAYDKDRNGQLRLTPWAAKASPDFTFTQADVIDNTLGVSLTKLRDVVNVINLNVKYRYARKWQRELRAGWHYPRPFIQYLADSTTLPERDMVLQALDSAWELKSINWIKMPPNGNYVLESGTVTTWYLSEARRNQLVWGVGFTAARRWLQDVTEDYSVRVASDASIVVHGEIAEESSYVVDLDVEDGFEEPAAESGLLVSNVGDAADTGTSIGYQAPDVSGVSVNDYDTIVDPADRSDYENAMLTGLALSRNRILASHRKNRLAMQCVLHPKLDLNHTVLVDATAHDGQAVNVKGKVHSIVDQMNIANGELVSNIELAFYQPSAAGQTDDAVAVPAGVDTTPTATPGEVVLGSHFGGRTTTPYNDAWQGYVGNWQTRTFPSEWYQEHFNVDMPEVEANTRDGAEYADSLTYRVGIPEDPLAITA